MRRVVIAAALTAAGFGVAAADDLIILVAPPGSAAAAHATTAADGKKLVATTALDDALTRGSTHLATCGACAVTIKLAAGTYAGPKGQGQWTVPDAAAPKAALRVLGGYDDAFAVRAPLTTHSVLITTPGRTGPVLAVGKLEVRELTLSGLAIDGGPSNRYDAASSSLMRGRSPSSPLLGLSSVTTDRLIIADNLFFNAPSGVAAPLVRPASASAEVIVRNNLFANNVIALSVKGPSTKHTLKRFLIADNSFVLNFPGNADTGTSNPGAVELGGKSAAVTVELRGNLFAYNVGGAIAPLWDAARSPAVVMNHNLFWRNGELFTPSSPAHGAVVGRVEGVTATLAADEVAVARGWSVSGNVARDPELAIPVATMSAHGKAPAADAPATPPADDLDVDSLFADPAELTLDTTIEPDAYAADGVVKNFAPRMPFNLAALPTAAKARNFGASPKKVQ